MATAKASIKKLMELGEGFVIKQKGCWEHSDWEGLVNKVRALGIEMNDEGKRNLGNILEGTRFFYLHMPETTKRKTAPRKRPAAGTGSSARRRTSPKR